MDWKKLLIELRENGATQKAIANECNCAQGTIGDLASGRTKEPFHSLGEKLIKLHAKLVRQSRKKHNRRINDVAG